MRSLIRTLTCRPFFLLITRTQVPKGRLKWAAVNLFRSKRSPLAVIFPWYPSPRPYQLASPSSRLPTSIRPGGGNTRGFLPQPAATTRSKSSSRIRTLTNLFLSARAVIIVP